MNAPDRILELKAAATAAISLIFGLLGASGVAVVIFFVCMVLDYVTGSLAARAHGEWSSRVAREGLWHKLGEIAALLVAALCDVALRVVLATAAAPIVGQVHYSGYLVLIVCFWYIITELGSILENAAKLGAPVPQWLITGIGKLKKKADKTEIVPDPDTGAQKIPATQPEDREDSAPELPDPQTAARENND